MRKLLKNSAILIVLIISVAMPGLAASASGIGFSAEPRLTADQREGVKGYFDLILEPGQQEELSITVANQGNEEIVVSVEAFIASTSSGGEINYSDKAIFDETLEHKLTDIITLSDTSLTIPAKSREEFTFTVTMPDEAFDGIILGSVYILKGATEEEKASGSMIVNQYAYNIPVKIAATDAEIRADFALGEVKVDTYNYRAAVVANIRNPQPKLSKGASASVKIYQVGKNSPVMELEKETVDFAPNSVFPFTIVDENGKGIKSGIYIAKIQVDYKGETWNFEHEFEITAEDAATVNDEAINQDEGGLPIMVFIIAGAAVALAILIAIIVALDRKRTRDLWDEVTK